MERKAILDIKIEADGLHIYFYEIERGGEHG